jgi:hypothetical protein
MSRYSFDPKLDPRRDKNRRMAIGAASISAAAIVGIGLIVVGCRSINLNATPTPTPGNKPSIGVTIFAPQPGQQPTAASGETPAEPANPSAPTPIPEPTQPATPMDPRGKVEGIPDFSCPSPRRAPDTFGYGIQSNWPVGDIGYWNSVMRDQLKVNWTKAQVRWKDFETAKGKDEAFKWQLLDAFTADANKKGLNIVYGVLSTPNWARSVQEREGPPDDYNEAARFMTRVLARYKGCVQAIEVWNEMNIDREWTAPSKQISAVEYINFLKVVVPAIRAVDQNITVVMGALSPTGYEAPGISMDDFNYMDAFVANGGTALVDCVGVHLNGYNMPPQYEWDEGYDDPTAKFRGPFKGGTPHHSWSFKSTMFGYYNRTKKPLCVTEFGWASSENMGGEPVEGFEFAKDNTEKEQAEWIVQGFQMMKDSGFVKWGIVFNLDYVQKDGLPFNQDPNAPYSVIRPDGAPRPAFEAIANIVK